MRSSLSYRPDIDGLRGLAVLGVVIAHYFPSYFNGGIVGPDLFFVISGFLITKILIDHLQAKNFSLKNFYAKRVNRLFPALLIAMIVPLILCFIFMPQAPWRNSCASGFFTSIFANNLFSVLYGIVYDRANGDNLFCHLWSLAVEEQFYFLWPLGLAWMHKKGLKLSSMLLVTLGFFLLSLMATIDFSMIDVNRYANYYSTPTRAWQLMAGCLLAMISWGYLLKENKPTEDLSTSKEGAPSQLPSGKSSSWASDSFMKNHFNEKNSLKKDLDNPKKDGIPISSSWNIKFILASTGAAGFAMAGGLLGHFMSQESVLMDENLSAYWYTWIESAKVMWWLSLLCLGGLFILLKTYGESQADALTADPSPMPKASNIGVLPKEKVSKNSTPGSSERGSTVLSLPPFQSHWLSFLALGLILSALIFSRLGFSFIGNFPGYRAILPVMASLFILMAGPRGFYNQWILSFQPLVFLGKMSYALYIWHFPLLGFWKWYKEDPYMSNQQGTLFIIMGISFCCALLTYLYIERPLRYQKNTKFLCIAMAAICAVTWLGWQGYIKPLGLADQRV